MMAKLPRELLERGVICSSAGNHAQGVALAAKRLNCSAVIAMPVTTPEIKVCFVYMFTFACLFVCFFNYIPGKENLFNLVMCFCFL